MNMVPVDFDGHAADIFGGLYPLKTLLDALSKTVKARVILLDAGLVRRDDAGGLQTSFDQLVLPVTAANAVTARAARRGGDTIDVLQIASIVGDRSLGSPNPFLASA